MRTSWLRWTVVLGIGALFLTGSALAQAPAAPSPETLRAERRVRLVKLWGDIRFRHPWAFARPAEWDAAFLAALPKVEAAKDGEAYTAAVQAMLATLGDPATLVERETPESSGPAPTLRALKSWEKDVLVLDLRNLVGPQGYPTLQELVKTVGEDVAKARVVVLDLRMRGLQRYGLPWVVPQLLPQLIAGELSVPGLREVQHTGLRPQDGSPNIYSTEFILPSDQVFIGTPGKKPGRLVFLVDTDSAIDLSLLSLRASGKALIVTEGPLNDSSTVIQDEVSLGEGYKALVRINESVLPVEADVVLPARTRLDGPDDGMRKALALTARLPKPKAGASSARPAAAWHPEPKYEDASYPSRELRLLAGAKLWTVVRFFFAYPHLMDRPWEERLPGLLEKLEAAKDAQQYVLALAEAGTWLQDGHVVLRGHPELQRFFGTPAAVWVTDIDGKAVVLEIYDPEAAPGLAPGDIIEKVDGEPIAARVQRIAPYVTGSTPGYLRDMTLRRALSGEEGSTATLSVRGAQGPKEVKLTRHPRFFQKQWAPSTTEPYRVLEGNIGFVDLGKLESGQVPAMYEKLKDTRGIVFDLRNYPRGSMWALGPYFNLKSGPRPFAQYEKPLVGGQRNGRLKLDDPVFAHEGPRYKGRTVTLIDARAISHAEHTGLMLETAADTLFVGSPTAGANGNVTHAVLPGGISFAFTGLDVRHGDGRQLQRKGLEPHVKLRPTVAGLQAGRDELLERAIQILREDKGSKATTRKE